MKEKLYGIVIAVLICIALILVGISLVVFSKSRQVDCDMVSKDVAGTGYKPVPKQCKKGE